MFASPAKYSVEILEARIAPAVLGAFPTIKDAEIAYDATNREDNRFVTATIDTPQLLRAGDVFTTGTGSKSGSYLMFVEKGQALVFTTDLNNNGTVDPNEITGIAAGDGLRLISFVDIHGDIVTNLDADRTLSDSNNNSADDDTSLKGDGRVLLPSRIEKIEFRSLRASEISDQNNLGSIDDATGRFVADDQDVAERLSLSTYSLHGSIYAGGGFGVVGGGLIIDDAGRALQSSEFGGQNGFDFFVDFKPTIGAIKVGSATSGEYFSFGIGRADNIQGKFIGYTPGVGVAGGDIIGVKAMAATTQFNVNSLEAGDGGLGARGGNIQEIFLNSDTAGGYTVIAGDGGRGTTGGIGGSITNFNDRGSVTSEIQITTGDGGTASTGSGGAGGNLTLGTMNLSGGLSITLGDGGDGFKAGGNGAGLTKGTIGTPAGGDAYTRQIIGSTHDPLHDRVTGLTTQQGIIGTHLPVDFNEDGLGDVVFTTSDPEQVVVKFGGNGFGGTVGGRLYLDAPIGAEALTVGDFNGDGHQDIATGSSDQGSRAGITVFLSEYEDINNDGILTTNEDLNSNGIDDFTGFGSALQSVLPFLQDGDGDAGLAFNSFFNFRRSGVAINDIAAGDFNGDGRTELAIAATFLTLGGASPQQVLMFMQPDVEDGRATGQFYADFGTKRVATPAQGANPLRPFFFTAPSIGSLFSTIEATALNTTDTRDVIVWSQFGPNAQQNFLTTVDNSNPSIAGPEFGRIIFPVVDTNRKLLSENGNFSGADFFIKDFTVLDFNSDGKVDYAAISESPRGYMHVMQGSGGLSGATLITTNPGTNDNQGLWFDEDGGFERGTTQVALRSGDLDGDGSADDIGVLDYLGKGPEVELLVIKNFAAPNSIVKNPGAILDAGNSAIIVDDFGRSYTGGTTEEVIAYDIYYPSVSSSRAGYAIASPSFAPAIPRARSISMSGEGDVPLTSFYNVFAAGNGGDALIGAGGNGGTLGATLAVATLRDDTGLAIGRDTVGSINITRSTNGAQNGPVNFVAGDGGNGFTTGGNGGSVTGISARYPAGVLLTGDVSLFGGDGGTGVSGRGGSGGDVSKNSIANGSLYVGGSGGDGLTGGSGGSILGNGIAGYYDSLNLIIELVAGEGGDGVRSGGAGGSVANFKTSFGLNVSGVATGGLSYTAGDGGNAVSGAGGAGGSIVNSSPLSGENNLAGDILLQGGFGGNGTSGGAGGSIRDFNNRPSQETPPALLSVLAGHGGDGTTGKGGAGGSVVNVQTPSRGKLTGFALPLTEFTFNRILAGNGGDSSAGNGGSGGIVSGINSSAQDNAFAVVGGAGGAGLYSGGAGGSVTNVQIQLGGGDFAKGLIIGGAGGDAFAFVDNPSDSTPNQNFKAFGGRVGIGGKGGSIVNFTQSGGISARVDLIAGNGGSTVNFGTVGDVRSFVGAGGSISNISLAGDVGNIKPGIPIKAYNDLFAGETIADFVESALRDPAGPKSIDDSVGNVGLVVGEAGRIKAVFTGYNSENEPVFTPLSPVGGVNGSVNGLRATNILAMVAGSVDRIAAIQVISGINVVPGAIVGASKIGTPDYVDRLGNATNGAVLDGALRDGAIVYRSGNIGNLPPDRVFKLGAT